jgi:hypothetical protein
MPVFSSLWKKSLMFIGVSGVAGLVAIVDTQVYPRDLRVTTSYISFCIGQSKHPKSQK